MFDKSKVLFPVKKDWIYVSHCGISPIYSESAIKAMNLIELQMSEGGTHFPEFYPDILSEIKKNSAELLSTNPDNIAFVKNTSEALSMIANGYPFKKGDEIISYIHEYPANHYPWRLQEQKGVKLRLLKNRTCDPAVPSTLPGKWLLKDLKKMISKRTRIFAISHVQFTSGFACDLKAIGKLCKKHKIDFIVDAAQSLGALPIQPEKWNISALASAGWKWLLGPFGTGLLYISPKFRKKIRQTQVGAETMQQGIDFLNHSWNPHKTAKRFEYSSSPFYLAAALSTSIEKNHLRHGIIAINQEIWRLQDLFLENFNHSDFTILKLPDKNRSGILALYHKEPKNVINHLKQNGIIASTRGGYIRIAAHYYNSDDEMIKVAEVLNNYG